MRNFFPLDAVVLSSSALTAALGAAYFPGRCDVLCRLHYRSIHDTYRVTAGSRAYYYKVYRLNLRTPAEIAAEAALLVHLAECGVPAVRPVAAADGGYVLTHPTPIGDRYGVLYEDCGGEAFDEADETREINEKLGRYLASMHAALDAFGDTYTRKPIDETTFIDESMDFARGFAELYPIDITFLEAVASKLKAKLATAPRSAPAFGLCHGDIYAGNMRITDGEPLLFDFDFMGSGWRCYDLTMYTTPFSLALDPEAREMKLRRRAHLLAGYESVRPLSNWEIQSIEVFVPFRRIFNIGTLYISMANTWGDDTAYKTTSSDIENLKKWLDLNPIF